MHLSGLHPAGVGACCLADGSCTVGPQSECTGLYQGDGTPCEPNPCGTPIRESSWGAVKDRYRRL